jgi:hypothetical protein
MTYIFLVFSTEMSGFQIKNFRLKHKDTIGFSCHDKKGKCHEINQLRGDSKKAREIRDNCESRDRTAMTSKIGVAKDKMVFKMKGSQDKTEWEKTGRIFR